MTPCFPNFLMLFIHKLTVSLADIFHQRNIVQSLCPSTFEAQLGSHWIFPVGGLPHNLLFMQLRRALSVIMLILLHAVVTCDEIVVVSEALQFLIGLLGGGGELQLKIGQSFVRTIVYKCEIVMRIRFCIIHYNILVRFLVYQVEFGVCFWNSRF